MSKGAGFAAAALVVLGVVGCGSKDSVTLSGKVTNVSLAIDQNALGTYLSGDFDLSLKLGSYASDPVSVEAPTFVLTDATTHSELGGRPLDATTPDVSFPIEIDPGDERTISFEIRGTEPLAVDVADRLCEGPLSIRGTVPHSLHGGGTEAFGSEAVTPEGCE